MIGVEKNFWRPAFLLGVLAFFLVVSSFGPAAHAQGVKDMPPPPPPWKAKPTPTPKPPEQEVLDVVRVTSNLVMVPVSVTDTQGNAIQGLTKPDFRLIEEGKEQEITDLGNPEQVPLSIALLFDVSSSVSSKGFFASQQNAAAAFLKLVMKPADRAAIFTITDEARLVQPLATAETSAAKMLTIPAATTPVPTAFYDTVIAAAKYLEANAPSNHRRVIVVLSDGDDNFSSQIRDLSLAQYRASQNSGEQATGSSLLARSQQAHRQAVAQVEQEVQKADAIFYSVNPGGPSVKLNQICMRAENSMESIAEKTGGTAFVPDSDKDLERVFRQVAAELRGQYLLQYYANAENTPGRFRRIQVTVPARADAKIRARQGYYPKAK